MTSPQIVYAVNALNGGWTLIPVTIPAHRCRIEEDGLTPQGLVIEFWNSQTGAWGPSTTWLAGEAANLEGHGVSGVLGYTGNYARVTSATATATNVRVTEIEQ